MDLTRHQSGEAIEGTFSAIWLFGQKVANALAPMALALILGMNDWKETSQGKVEQTADAIQALQVSITMIPAAVLMLAILGLLFIYRPAAPLASQN